MAERSPQASLCPVPLGATPRPECPGGERRSHCRAQGPRWSLLLLGTLTERSLLPEGCMLCPGALRVEDITTYSHIHTHIHTSMHSLTYTPTHTHTHMHSRIHTHSCTHLHSHTHACTHTHTRALTYALIHTHTHSLMHSYTLTHSHTRTHSHTHRHSHTHTHKIFTIFCSSSSLSQSWPEGFRPGDWKARKPSSACL